MDKREAIEFLKEKLGVVTALAKLPYGNQEYPLWCDEISDVLEEVFGRDSTEYQRFFGAFVRVSIPGEGQRLYEEELGLRHTAILSIIRKYENLGIDTKSNEVKEPPKAFISHGKESAALRKLREFIETLGIEPLLVKEQPSLDRDLPDKVNLYLSQADFIIILATADDKVGDKLQPRQNVIHEIGLAQKTHSGRIIYLLEEGAEFPSNIRPKVWESFKKRNMMNAFLGIVRELRAYGMLEVVKPE